MSKFKGSEISWHRDRFSRVSEILGSLPGWLHTRVRGLRNHMSEVWTHKPVLNPFGNFTHVRYHVCMYLHSKAPLHSDIWTRPITKRNKTPCKCSPKMPAPAPNARKPSWNALKKLGIATEQRRRTQKANRLSTTETFSRKRRIEDAEGRSLGAGNDFVLRRQRWWRCVLLHNRPKESTIGQ